MNKKDFIKELEKKLEILDEKEIKDIVNEYKDIIDEKVKNGKTEQEAVSEFGSIDELASEILKAYKINPKYSNANKDNIKEAKENYEGWIRETAKTLSETAKGVYDNLKKSNNDISVELVFELVIKFIIMLIILAVLRLPFEIINGLGEGIFDMAFYPANEVFTIVWKMFTSVLYFGVCILIFIAMFKEYVNYNKDNVEISKTEIAKNKKKEKEEKTSNYEVKTSNDVMNETIKTNRNSNINSGINNVLSIIFKLFMVFTFIIPLCFTQLGFVIAFGVTIYYACVGINIWGLVIVLLGLIIGAGWAINIFTQLTFKIKKVYFYPVFISLVVICVGGLIFANNILSFNYIDEAPITNKFSYATQIEEFNLSSLAPIETKNVATTFEVDQTLEDNKVRIEITYCSSFDKINSITLRYDNYHNNYSIDYYEYESTDFNDFKKAYNLFIDNLKDGELYNYEKLTDVSIKVFANENTLTQIKG